MPNALLLKSVVQSTSLPTSVLKLPIIMPSHLLIIRGAILIDRHSETASRVLEPNSSPTLAAFNSRGMGKTIGARYENGTCSLDWTLCDHSYSVIKPVAEDLIKIIREVVKSDVFVFDFSFKILISGGRAGPRRQLRS